MQTFQARWSPPRGWDRKLTSAAALEPQLLLLFGAPERLTPAALREIRDAFPRALLFGCSTAGEIAGESVVDDSLVLTAARFERTSLRSAEVEIGRFANSFDAGRALARRIPAEGLRHAFVLSDGLKVNGSMLVRGLADALPRGVGLTGGLSGDGPRFKETFVIEGERVKSGSISILGLYGESLRVGCGSLGGWDPFGPDRRITRAKDNVLYELDGEYALSLYKSYLGEHAQGLPSTGLLFPLCLRAEDGRDGVVRTVLSVDEKEQSMTFAGDMPQGSYTRLMKANFDRLVDGALGAARSSCQSLTAGKAELAILISCVGRKMVLKQRIEEEVEAVRKVIGPRATMTGFYSYGEISPFTPNAKCELHNQTMTITTFCEE